MGEKFFLVVDNDGDNCGNKFDDRAKAEAYAKLRATQYESATYFIMEAVAIVQQPKPPVEVVAL